MSDFMQSIAGGNGRRSSGRGNSRPIQANICIRISGSDLSAAHGGVVNGVVVAPGWMAGDEVKVRLMNEQESVETFRKKFDEATNKKFFAKGRPTVASLMGGYKVGSNHVTAMKEGGFLMCYGATKDEAMTKQGGEGAPTVWRAQFMENFGNDLSRSVLHGAARVTVDQAPGRAPRGHIDLLDTRGAVEITNIDELRSFFGEHMEGQRDGVEVNCNSLIRIFSPDGNQVKPFWVYSPRQKHEVEAADGSKVGVSIADTAEAAWNEAIVEGKQARGLGKVVAAALQNDFTGLEGKHLEQATSLRKELEAGTLKIEAVPGRRIPLVGKSLEDVMDDGSKLNRAANACVIQTENNGIAFGFVPMAVGTMTNRKSGLSGNLPDGTIVTKFTADEFAKARDLEHLATAVLRPVFTKKREEEQEQVAAQAALEGSVQASDFQEADADQVMGSERDLASEGAAMDR